MYHVVLQVCFLGDAGCGKTELCGRFMKEGISEAPRPTKATTYSERSIELDGGAKMKIMAWDYRKSKTNM